LYLTHWIIFSDGYQRTDVNYLTANNNKQQYKVCFVIFILNLVKMKHSLMLSFVVVSITQVKKILIPWLWAIIYSIILRQTEKLDRVLFRNTYIPWCARHVKNILLFIIEFMSTRRYSEERWWITTNICAWWASFFFFDYYWTTQSHINNKNLHSTGFHNAVLSLANLINWYVFFVLRIEKAE
jgi:hypothetical protein